jgi:hypothetical protein
MSLQVTGRGGVPPSGVTAVVLNVTVTQPTADSWLTAWPSGATRPVASNLNFVAGQTVPNLVVVKVGSGGMVDFFNKAGSVDVIADVAGWYGGVTEGARFHSLTPSRILDTRLGAPPAKLGPGATMGLQVTGNGGVPASGVSAVVLNVTVTNPTSEGWLTAWPAGEVRPVASNLNFVAGQTVPNLVMVKVGPDGTVNLFNSAGSTDVIADVAGWYGDSGAPGGAGFSSLPPTRILDTRSGIGSAGAPLPAGTPMALFVTGHGGVPPSGVSAVVLNITVTGPGSAGWLTVWPSGQPKPVTSNLNYVAGQTVPNLVVVAVGEGGVVDLFSSGGPVDLIADVAGWYSG